MTDPDDGPFHYWPQTPPPRGLRFYPPHDATRDDFDVDEWLAHSPYATVYATSADQWRMVWGRRDNYLPTRLPRYRRALRWLRRCGR